MATPKRVLRTPPQPPAGPPSRRPAAARAGRPPSEQVGIALALVLVVGLGGLLVVGLATSPGPTASGSASAAPSDDTSGLESDVPEESTGPESPVLEAMLPTTVGDATMTIQSAVDATTLSGGPDGRALNAAIVHLGKTAADLEIAVAYDESGGIDLSILGFRVDGVAAEPLREVVLSAWLAAGTPGVTSTTLSWSGATVTKVSYGDEGMDEYVITVDDAVFVLETADATLAQTAAGLLTGSASATPAASTVPAASPGS